MSGRILHARGLLVVATVAGAAMLLLGAIYLAPAAPSVQAQAGSASSTCAPYDSTCVYCQNHPTSSICPTPKPAATQAPAQAATAAPAAQATAQPASTAAGMQSTAKPSPAPTGCAPYDSVCAYCQAHPGSSACKP